MTLEEQELIDKVYNTYYSKEQLDIVESNKQVYKKRIKIMKISLCYAIAAIPVSLTIGYFFNAWIVWFLIYLPTWTITAISFSRRWIFNLKLIKPIPSFATTSEVTKV